MIARKTIHIASFVAAACAALALPAQAAESNSQFMQNAAQRCAPLPQGYQQACLERVQGAGTRSGSVEGGGILRESSTTATLGTQLNLPAAASNQAVAAQVRAGQAQPRKAVKKHQPASKKKHKAVKPAKPVAAKAPAQAALAATRTPAPVAAAPAAAAARGLVK